MSTAQHQSFKDFILKGRKKESIERQTRRSSKWLINRIREYQKTTNKGQTARPGIGGMYLFNYSAKHDETLPYWDRFPLIIMVGPAKGGFYGLNMHYLPPRKRLILLSQLMDVSNIKHISDKTRLKLNYGIVKSAASSNLFKATFKHYLHSQVRSKPIVIPATEWESVVTLPLANFKRATRPKVYADVG